MPIKVLLTAITLVSAVACATTTPTSPMSEYTTAGSASEASTTNSIVASPALMQRLQKARTYDLSNSTAFTRSAPSLDHYYSRKANQVTDVMTKLRSGQEVPRDDIDHALDNSLASTFGVPVP